MNRSDRIILAIALVVLILPLLLPFFWIGERSLFAHFWPDAYYYLQVARNYGQLGLFSYDGNLPTNGFHPLWMWYLGFMFQLGADMDQNGLWPFYIAFATEILALSLVLIAVAVALQRNLGRVPVGFVVLPLGVVGLAICLLPHGLFGSMVLTWIGTLWSMINGMESTFVLLAYGAFVYLAAVPGFPKQPLSAFLSGLALAGVALARLDHALLAAVVCCHLGIITLVRHDWVRLKRVVLMGLTITLFVGAYLIWNKSITGVWMPVSGSLKSSFPQAHVPSPTWFINQFLPPYDWKKTHIAWRYIQILVPSAVALFWFVWLNAWRRAHTPLDMVLSWTAGFVLLLAAYNFLFVALMHQGEWYFPVSILFSSVVVVRVFSPPQGSTDFRPHRVTVAAFMGLLTLVFWLVLLNPPSFRDPFYNFVVHEGPRIQAHYQDTSPAIVEADDGIIAYTTGFQSLSGSGLMLDIEGIQAKLDHRLLDLAYDRGYRHFTSFSYLPGRLGISLDSSNAELRQILERLPHNKLDKAELDNFQFSVDYLAKDKRFAILRFERRNRDEAHHN